MLRVSEKWNLYGTILCLAMVDSLVLSEDCVYLMEYNRMLFSIEEATNMLLLSF